MFKIVYLTAGAGGMYCGSCLHDNTLATALIELGLDVQLIPTYTPIRTDEIDVSVDQVFFGGINVFLQQRFPPLRWLPKVLDRFLDNPWLIKRVTSKSIDMSMSELGKLTLSMLSGVAGNQKKEVKRICSWLAGQNLDAILFTNILIGGCIPEIKRQLDVKVVVTLQGDDVFLDSLPENYREKCIGKIKSIDGFVDGYIVHSEFYRQYMSEYFGIEKQKIKITPLGIDVNDFQAIEPRLIEHPTIGYLARLAPEKGFHQVVDAFIRLKQNEIFSNTKLKIAGWLGESNREYAESNFQRIRDAGLGNEFDYCGAVDRRQKVEFLRGIHVLSVPTEFLEPKGLYAFEAMAAKVPVVQPAHGCFPELIAQTGGGLLFAPGDLDDYCSQLEKILGDHDLRDRLSEAGHETVTSHRNSSKMAEYTLAVLKEFLV